MKFSQKTFQLQWTVMESTEAPVRESRGHVTENVRGEGIRFGVEVDEQEDSPAATS